MSAPFLLPINTKQVGKDAKMIKKLLLTTLSAALRKIKGALK